MTIPRDQRPWPSSRTCFLSHLNRSGSTFLATLLDSHPNVMVTPEAAIPVSLSGARPASIRSLRELNAYVRFLFDDYKLQSWGVDADELLAVAGSHLPLPCPADQLFGWLLRLYVEAQPQGRRDGCQFVIYKGKPQLRDYVRTDRAPDLIYVYRDPRAVYASQSRVVDSVYGQTMATDPAVFARRWTRDIRIVIEAENQPFLAVKYENLVRDRERTLATIFSRLGLARGASSGGGGMQYGEQIPDRQLHLHRRLSVEPDATRIDAWRGQLSERVAATICREAGVEMRAMGYDCPGADASAPASLVANSGRQVVTAARSWARLWRRRSAIAHRYSRHPSAGLRFLVAKLRGWC